MGGASRVTCWGVSGSILILFSLAFTVFASAFPYWYQRHPTRGVGYPNIGLWEICFRDDGEPAPVTAGDPPGSTYYGCQYVFDRELRFILGWIYPGWFILVTALVTLGFILQPLALLLNVLYYVRVCSSHTEHVLMGVSTLLTTGNGFGTAIAVLVFGVESDKNNEWLPNPESRHLSWSWAVCAAVPILAWLAGMCHAVEFLRLKSIRDRNARAKVYERGDFSSTRY